MRKLLILSVMVMLLFNVDVANAAPELDDHDANEASEVIEVQEGLNVATEDRDDDTGVNEAEESPDEVELEGSEVTGTIEAISETSVTIDSVVYAIDGNTELDEGLHVGAVASVEFVTLADGTLVASEVETDAPDDLDEDEDENEVEDEDVDEDEDENEVEDEDADENEQEFEEEHDNSGHGSENSDHDESED